MFNDDISHSLNRIGNERDIKSQPSRETKTQFSLTLSIDKWRPSSPRTRLSASGWTCGPWGAGVLEFGWAVPLWHLTQEASCSHQYLQVRLDLLSRCWAGGIWGTLVGHLLPPFLMKSEQTGVEQACLSPFQLARSRQDFAWVAESVWSSFI